MSEQDTASVEFALRHSEEFIRVQLRDRVAERLGPEFTVSGLTVRRGSVELLVLIGLVGTAIETYGAVREGLSYLRKDGQSIVQGVIQSNVPGFLNLGLEVLAYCVLGPAMATLEGAPVTGTTSGTAAKPTFADFVTGPAYFVVVITLVILLLLGTLMTVVLVKVL